jgi:hypothetical protein
MPHMSILDGADVATSTSLLVLHPARAENLPPSREARGPTDVAAARCLTFMFFPERRGSGGFPWVDRSGFDLDGSCRCTGA